MNLLWNLGTVLILLFHSSTQFRVGRKSSCVIDEDKTVTLNNFKYNCQPMELLKIFSNLSAGRFPPNGFLNGTILLRGLESQNIWNGKRISFRSGVRPDDRGALSNRILNSYDMFNADVYRTMAPIDGREAFALNYKHDRLVFFVMDYIREVQENLYLGIMTIRPFNNIPVVYFALEKV